MIVIKFAKFYRKAFSINILNFQIFTEMNEFPYLPSCRVLGRSTSGMIIFHLLGNLLLNITLWFKYGKMLH